MITKEMKAIDKRVSSISRECEMFLAHLTRRSSQWCDQLSLETFLPSVHLLSVFCGDGKVKNARLHKI